MGVFKMFSKWPLIREEHCIFFIHVHSGECFFTYSTIQNVFSAISLRLFVLFTVQTFVEVFISPSSRVTELSPRE